MLRQIIAIVAVVPALCAAQPSRQSLIFLVQAHGCPGSLPDRQLTAFRVVGVSGVLTTLHGVAGCQSILLQSENGPALTQPVDIQDVYIDSDLATLNSTELTNKYPGALTWAHHNAVPGEALTVYGYPERLLHLLKTASLTVRDPAYVPLSQLVPQDLTAAMGERASPSTLLGVISIDGHLLPGHSGAPIFDRNNEVVAVADGGLKSGAVAISWAIPLNGFGNLRPKEGSKRYSAVERDDPAALFFMTESPEAPSPTKALSDAVTNDDMQSLQRLLVASFPQDTLDSELLNAVHNNSIQALDLLIRHGANPSHYQVLCQAVEERQPQSIQVLARYPNLIRPNDLCDGGLYRMPPLIAALDDWQFRGNVTLDVVTVLLSISGIDVNESGPRGTALHYSAEIGDPSLVSLLLRVRGIDKSIRNSNGSTAADLACFNHPGVLKLLVDAGARGGRLSEGDLKYCEKQGRH